MVREEETKQDAIEAAEAAAVAAAAAAEKSRLATAAAGGMSVVGLVAGGLADGAFANGGAPWASPLGCLVIGAATYAAALQVLKLLRYHYLKPEAIPKPCQ